MNETISRLADLVKSYPGLPVICVLPGKTFKERTTEQLASVGSCRVGEFARWGDEVYTDRCEFMSDYWLNYDEPLGERFGYDQDADLPGMRRAYTAEQLEANAAAKKKLEAYLEGIADKLFRRAIIIDVDAYDGPEPEEDPGEEDPDNNPNSAFIPHEIFNEENFERDPG